MTLQPHPTTTVYHAPSPGPDGTLHLQSDCGGLAQSEPVETTADALPDPTWCRRCASEYGGDGDA